MRGWLVANCCLVTANKYIIKIIGDLFPVSCQMQIGF